VARSPQRTHRALISKGNQIAAVSPNVRATGWQEIPYSFAGAVRDTQVTVEIAAAGSATSFRRRALMSVATAC
jgi:hypothetical protein